MHLAPATLVPAFVATARTTALATSDSRHHALAPGAVRRTQDTNTSPATMRQRPPAKGKNRGKPSSTGSPSPDAVVADGFMRMDLRQAKHETVQICEGPYPQVLPLGEPTKPAAAVMTLPGYNPVRPVVKGRHDRTPLPPTEDRYALMSPEDMWRMSQVLPPTPSQVAYRLFCEEMRGKPLRDAWSAKTPGACARRSEPPSATTRLARAQSASRGLRTAASSQHPTEATTGV
jgi:hypothetical protein